MSRALRIPTLVLALILVGGAASPARGVGTADLSWNGCSPIVPAVTNPIAGPHRLVVSVLGQQEAHEAYEMYLFVYRSANLPFPDAWRFDVQGCQRSSPIAIQHLPQGSLAKTCPAFQSGTTGLQIKQYDYIPSTGRARLSFANWYGPGGPAPNPATRYFLLGVVFDHSFSVVGTGEPGATCGGFESDMIVSFGSSLDCSFGCTPVPLTPKWQDPQGVQHDFAIGQGTVTFCGSCAPVPVRGATWGQIKGQYRR